MEQGQQHTPFLHLWPHYEVGDPPALHPPTPICTGKKISIDILEGIGSQVLGERDRGTDGMKQILLLECNPMSA